ncbi:uncharacterized protein K02A2.6-like [Mizuhopecten yessoensis]|uniref:uncharacterized protein K02A2.6-like n=1 Tax=Mizuhopecten yessoensis TaxID=6573 RepID=UPI000B45EAF6|nr:uncharacterized protein K02A2.6-like [Mizuhopecten yessoensis]
MIIPPRLRTRVLEELHSGHIGVVKMKALARSYVWWPGIDKDIETMTKSCNGCQNVKHAPPAAQIHQWEWPYRPWSRLHIDFAGPFLGSMFFVVVDTNSKWPEVVQMNTTTSEKTIEVLRTKIARNGIPRQIVSDNGPQFVSEEFRNFVKSNGIRHSTSAPYHPSTNGLAERFVQSFKMAMRSSAKDHEATTPPTSSDSMVQTTSDSNACPSLPEKSTVDTPIRRNPKRHAETPKLFDNFVKF